MAVGFFLLVWAFLCACWGFFKLFVCFVLFCFFLLFCFILCGLEFLCFLWYETDQEDELLLISFTKCIEEERMSVWLSSGVPPIPLNILFSNHSQIFLLVNNVFESQDLKETPLFFLHLPRLGSVLPWMQTWGCYFNNDGDSKLKYDKICNSGIYYWTILTKKQVLKTN